MTRFVQALLVGMFITFILDFFIFLGIFLNYINFYEIDLYYNILFADNQSIYLYFIISLLLGVFITYTSSKVVRLSVLISLTLLSLSTLIPSIGNSIGEAVLMKKNVTYHDSKHTFNGDTYYDGRDTIVFYDYELKKIIQLKKKELKK